MADKNGHTMLHASKSMTLTKVGSHWQLPQDANIFDPMLSFELWIDVPNVSQARIVELDEDGKTKHVEYLYSGEKGYGDGFYFTSATAGLTNAIIILEFWDEKTGEQTSRAYKIGGPGGGSMITTTEFYVTPNSGFERVFKNYTDPKLPSYVGGAVPVSNGSGNNPIYEVVLTSTADVAFSAYTVEQSSSSALSDTRWAIGFKVIAIDVSGEIYQFNTENGSHLLLLKLGPGTYYVYPVWREGDFYPLQSPYLPYKYWGYGKG
jgi:hypothetical protein